MRKQVASLALGLLLAFSSAGAAQTRNLDIYWIDVEGGAATLIVSPSGESLLYDAGYETGDRDAKRIYAVAQAAGLTKIDYFVLSHFHADHAGGSRALAKLIPFGRCFDRGDFIEPMNQQWRDAYMSGCADKRTILNASDTIPLKGVQVDIVASNGHFITRPLPGAKVNPLCATAETHPPDVAENQLMVGALFTYGRFTFIDLADLDWEAELELTCPYNRVGEVSIWQAGRHGALDARARPGFSTSSGRRWSSSTTARTRALAARPPEHRRRVRCTTTASPRRRASKASGRDTARFLMPTPPTTHPSR